MTGINALRIRSIVSKCRSLPFKIIVKKIYTRLGRLATDISNERNDKRRKTFSCVNNIACLNVYFRPISIESLLPHSENIALLCRKYIDHEFDLLGSGWIQIKHGMHCPGIEGIRYNPNIGRDIQDTKGKWLLGRINCSNESYARWVCSLVGDDYTPIDWQLDFKSGYRWDESTWYKKISYGDNAGADVKVPWELSRMQHLAQFALAYALSKNENSSFLEPDRYLSEFVKQILDFIGSNPPRFGVNWNSTMDVSIRAVNWLVAYDLFKAHGALFDDAFEKVFFSSIYDHGKHIADNLEYSTELRGNHYLSNLAGLLYVSAYLPNTQEVESWMAFAIGEMILEYDIQYNNDGSNFEGSTSYHRLSTEILIYSVALIKRLPSDRLNHVIENSHKLVAAFVEKGRYEFENQVNRKSAFRFNKFIKIFEKRLVKTSLFTVDMIGPSNQSVQIGDTDNGRFLKLQPVIERLNSGEAYREFLNLEAFKPEIDSGDYLVENHLDHRHLISAANGLLIKKNLRSKACKEFYEESIVRNLACSTYRQSSNDIAAHKTKDEINASNGLLNNLRQRAYPDFGLYVYRSDNLYLVIRCGPLGQNGFGGHAHNDQLSIVLAINNQFLFVDPGSYVYTNLPERRNLFRSTQMHNTLAHKNLEQNDFVESTLFALREKTNTKLLMFEQIEFQAEHYAYEKPHRRTIKIRENGIRISDDCAIEDAFLNLHLHYGVDMVIDESLRGALLSTKNERFKISISDGYFSEVESLYSPAYGWIRRMKTIRISDFGESIEWNIEVVK